MGAALHDEGWDIIGTHSLRSLEAFDGCTDSVGRNGRHKY